MHKRPRSARNVGKMCAFFCDVIKFLCCFRCHKTSVVTTFCDVIKMLGFFVTSTLFWKFVWLVKCETSYTGARFGHLYHFFFNHVKQECKYSILMWRWCKCVDDDVIVSSYYTRKLCDSYILLGLTCSQSHYTITSTPSHIWLTWKYPIIKHITKSQPKYTNTW